MFKLHRHRTGVRSSGEKLEFKFSQFQAFQVPQGWDKLYLSIISTETGKTIAKSGKSLVRGGTCQWTETLSESIWVSCDDAKEEFDECLFKIVVSMGSVRSAILGEVVLNLRDFISSRDSGPLQLPLKDCNYGTILQVRIQCLPARIKSRDGKSWMKTASRLEETNTNNDDMENKSDVSDNMSRRSGGSFSSNPWTGTSFPDEPGNRETNFSASGSHKSSDSGEIATARTNFSPSNSLDGGTYNLVGRQDSATSLKNATYGTVAGDDMPRSNHSSFNSRASGSPSASQWSDMPAQNSAHAYISSSLRSSGSSKDLLEAAEEAIDELRDEAKMWERHARKLKLDLEILKKECSNKTKHIAHLDAELSAACSERGSLKQELENVKFLLEESKGKITLADTSKFEDTIHLQKELEDELRFQKESNASLSVQLTKTQESNIELVSILQELEEMVEKQRDEIAILSQHRETIEPERSLEQKLVDMEAEWAQRVSAKEKEIFNLEEQVKAQSLHKTTFHAGHPDLLKVIESLKAKVQELEKDCAELTEENLDLIFKTKGLQKEGSHGNDNDNDLQDSILCHSESLSFQVKDLEKRCDDLEVQVQFHKNEACKLDRKLRKSQEEIEEKDLELNELRRRFQASKCTGASSIDGGENESWVPKEFSIFLTEVNKQLLLALAHVKNLSDENHSNENYRCADVQIPITDSYLEETTEMDQMESIVTKIIELNDLLRAKVVEHKAISDRAGLEEGSSTIEDGSSKSMDQITEMDEVMDAYSIKVKEVDTLKSSIIKLEHIISTFESEKKLLVENLEIAYRESHITSKCLDDVRHDMVVLTNNMEVAVSANKMLERTLMELESSKTEMESHAFDLEQENVQLSERISGLEAQLTHLKKEKESNRVELETSRSLVVDLKGTISRQNSEMETQIMEIKEKLQKTQKQLVEVQEESETLRGTHSKSQATIENLMEECTSLKKLTISLKRQNLELHAHNSRLEGELSAEQKKQVEFLNKIESLESKLTSLHKDIISKDASLLLQLETLYQKQKEHENEISETHTMLNKIDFEKAVELVNLQKELAHVMAQMSSTDDERSKIASDAISEASNLRSEKAKLESSLQEAYTKGKLYESELHQLRQESSNKVQGLVDLLNASKQSEQVLMTDIERMQRTIAEVKSSEEKFKKSMNELEVKLEDSDYEKQQMTEEISNLRVQLQKIAQLQDEVLALRSDLDDAKFGKQQLVDSLKLVSEECKELKLEKTYFTDKISDMKKALDDAEDTRRTRIDLEEQLMRLDGDLVGREVSLDNESQLNNELNNVMRTCSEYHIKVQCLVKERDELLRKAEALEKELIATVETNKNQKVLSQESSVGLANEDDLKSQIHLLETELAEAVEANNVYKVQLQRFLDEKQKGLPETSCPNGENGTRTDEASRISQLEAELKDMRERYLQMSLQYAEVEAQREEMVLKLKSMKKDKGWFS